MNTMATTLCRCFALLLAVGLGLLAPSAQAAPLSFERSRPTVKAQRVAIVGATVHDGTGKVIENATVELEGARIISVGSAPASAGAKLVDAKGKLLTPGFIAAATPLGLVEIDAESSARDHSRSGDLIQAGHDAALAINAQSSLLAVAAIEGVTTAASTPRGGMLSGQTAWIDLLTGHHRDIVSKGQVAISGTLGQAFGGSRSATLAKLAEVLDDARFYRTKTAAFDRRASRDLSAHRLDLEALGPVLGREIPLVLRADRASDILALIDLAADQKLRVVITSGAQAWHVADELAAANIPVIVQPTSNLPGSLAKLGARMDSAALLHAAGVEVGIAVLGEAHNVRNVSQEAGIAIANGLPREVALSAITSTIARAYGMDADYGSLTAGKVANIVLWPGDPFELSTMPEQVWIRGEAIRMRSRQTELRDRYLDLRGYP